MAILRDRHNVVLIGSRKRIPGVRRHVRRRRDDLRRRAFTAWREPTQPPDRRLRAAVARDLARVDLFDEPRWPAARRGDASAAISIAIEALWDNRIVDRRRDLILCALWFCAASGDVTAQLVLEMLRVRVAIRRPA